MSSKKVVKMVKSGDVKKKVDVLERLLLLKILPNQGSYTNLMLVRKIREQLSFTEAEHKRLQFRNETGEDGQPMLHWNTICLKNKETGAIVTLPDPVLRGMLAKDPDKFTDVPACPPKELFFGEVIEGLIKKALLDLDKSEQLPADYVSLYEKFVQPAAEIGE